MYERIRTLFTHTTVYGLGDVATSIMTFLLLPVFTSYLTPADYGILALLLLAGAVSKTTFRFGMEPAFMRLWYDCADLRARQQLASTIFFFLLVVNSLLLAAGMVAAPVIADILIGSPAYANVLRIFMIQTLAVGLFFLLPFSILRIQKRSGRFAAWTFSRAVAVIAMRLVLVAGFGMGVLGVVVADLAVTAVYALLLSPTSAPLVRVTFSRTVLAEALRFGLPRLPPGIGHHAVAMSDRYLLSLFTTVSTVGVYSIGATLGLALRYFLSAFQFAWAPFVFETMDEPDARETYRAVTTYVLLLMVLLAAGLSAIAADVVRLMTPPPFHEAARVVPWIALAALLQGVYQLTSAGLSIVKRTNYYLVAFCAAAATSIGGNLLLIPRFGMIGAAWTQTIAYSVLAAVGMAVSQWHYPIRYEWGRLLKLAVAGLVSYALGAGVSLNGGPLAGLIVRGLVVTASYSALLLALGFFHPNEKRRLLQILTRRTAVVER